jgi:hypothetical protein
VLLGVTTHGKKLRRGCVRFAKRLLFGFFRFVQPELLQEFEKSQTWISRHVIEGDDGVCSTRGQCFPTLHARPPPSTHPAYVELMKVVLLRGPGRQQS